MANHKSFDGRLCAVLLYVCHLQISRTMPRANRKPFLILHEEIMKLSRGNVLHKRAIYDSHINDELIGSAIAVNIHPLLSFQM